MNRLRSLASLIALGTVVLICCPSAAAIQEDEGVSATVSIGGVGRGLGGQWALIKAAVGNRSDIDSEVTVIVTPHGSKGTQFVRRIQAPAKVLREVQWPVFASVGDDTMLHFDYIVLRGRDNTGQVQRRFAEEVVRTVSISNPAMSPTPSDSFCGWISSLGETKREGNIIEKLQTLMRTSSGLSAMLVGINADTTKGYPEALHILDQVTVSMADLHEYPETCDAVRLWIQQGGRALILVDQTGPEVVSALLGDAFPFTYVDETTVNTISLDVNPQTLETLMPTRRVEREFEEPVRLVRVMTDAGYVHWSMDDWPVVLQLPLGRGQVLLSFMSPEVYTEDVLDSGGQPVGVRIGPLGEQIRDAMYVRPPVKPLVSPDVLAKVAADRVGYEIPSAGFAAVVMFGFSLALLGIGLIVYRREQASMLLWLVPLLAGAAIVPAIMAGAAARQVASRTAIGQHVVHVASGQTTLALDGVMSVYCPEPGTLDISATDYARFNPSGEQDELEHRRLVWTDRGESSWQNLTQSTGIRNYEVRSLLRLDKPSEATATFDADGLIGQLNSADRMQPSDALIAGLSPDRMAVSFSEDGTFRATPADILAPAQFSMTTLLSDDQLSRAAIYSEVFTVDPGAEVFPYQPSLLFWSDSVVPPVSIGGDDMQQHSSTLVVQPLRLTAPPANTRITIPAPLLPYRAVVDQAGGIGSVFSNRLRMWNEVENASAMLLRFEIPEVCHPFRTEFARLDLRIRAGLRDVEVSAGAYDDLKSVTTLNSPVGLFTLEIPLEHLQFTERDNGVYLGIVVSDVAASGPDGVSDGERDDTWEIERVMLTLQGQRIE